MAEGKTLKQELKSINHDEIYEVGQIKNKNCLSKDSIKTVERLATELENIFETHDKGLVSRIHEQLLQNKKETANLVKTRQWRPDWPLQGETQMTNI